MEDIDVDQINEDRDLNLQFLNGQIGRVVFFFKALRGLLRGLTLFLRVLI